VSAFYEHDDPSRFTDLGHNHFMQFMGFHPDRALNPQYADVPDVERYSVWVAHETKDGKPCQSAITLDSPTARRIDTRGVFWPVVSWEPFTVTPSLLCVACGDHGFIREGKWVPA